MPTAYIERINLIRKEKSLLKYMPGYFAAYDKNTGKLLGRYRYSTVSDVTKIWLKRNLDDIVLKCCCNENKVEMKVSSDLKIYPAENGTGHLHALCCPKNPNSADLGLWHIEKEESKYFNVASPEANASDYAKKINRLVDEYLYRKKIYPSDYKEFNKHVYYILNYVKAADGTILKDHYFSNFRNMSKVSTTDEIFIYGIVRKIQSTDFSQDVVYIDIEDIFGKLSRFYITKRLFLEFYNASRVNHYRSLACGFAYKANSSSKILTISDFYMAPISEIGILF